MARAAPQGEKQAASVCCLEAFISLLQAGILGEVSGEDFSKIFISSPGAPFQGHGLHPLTGQWQGSSVIAIGPGVTHLVLLLFCTRS